MPPVTDVYVLKLESIVVAGVEEVLVSAVHPLPDGAILLVPLLVALLPLVNLLLGNLPLELDCI